MGRSLTVAQVSAIAFWILSILAFLAGLSHEYLRYSSPLYSLPLTWRSYYIWLIPLTVAVPLYRTLELAAIAMACQLIGAIMARIKVRGSVR